MKAIVYAKELAIETCCPNCGKITTHMITEDEYTQLTSIDRPHIQDIFPNMKKEIREQFITGICPDCWDKIFKKNRRT